MAYEIELANRVNAALTIINPPDLDSKKMFGGVGYMVQGNMACGVLGNKLIVRVGKEAYEESLKIKGVTVFNTTGRPMTGWVMVDASILLSETDVISWVDQGVDFALSLHKK